MYVGQILKADSANGPGIRVSVFVSGCTNCCKGCFQPETWDFNFGRHYNKEMENFIIEELSKTYYRGLTVLGGEPFEPENQGEVLNLVKRVKNELQGKDIWIYSGCVYDTELIEGGRRHTEFTDEILANTDVLVDGRFVEELKNITLLFRGSENQRIIDMRATRQSGKVVEISDAKAKH